MKTRKMEMQGLQYLCTSILVDDCGILNGKAVRLSLSPALLSFSSFPYLQLL